MIVYLQKINRDVVQLTLANDTNYTIRGVTWSMNGGRNPSRSTDKGEQEKQEV